MSELRYFIHNEPTYSYSKIPEDVLASGKYDAATNTVTYNVVFSGRELNAPRARLCKHTQTVRVPWSKKESLGVDGAIRNELNKRFRDVRIDRVK